jgi:hypothetical protein
MAAITDERPPINTFAHLLDKIRTDVKTAPCLAAGTRRLAAGRSAKLSYGASLSASTDISSSKNSSSFTGAVFLHFS